MSDPLLRQWEMLKLIPRERKITVKDLHHKLQDLGFSVSRRTLERDLDRLSIPFCLESDTRSKPYGWRYALNMNSYSLPGLTSSESLTLILLESYLKNLLPVAVADNLAAQFAAARQFFSLEHPDLKLQDWLKKIQVVSPGQPLLAPNIQPRIQRTFYEALLHSYQLEMDYLTSGEHAKPGEALFGVLFNPSQNTCFPSLHRPDVIASSECLPRFCMLPTS